MEYYVELKLRGDAQPDGFTNGLTLCQSQSTKDLVLESENEHEKVYTNARKHKVTLHMRKKGDAIETYSTFYNGGEERATLEMLSSFAIKGVPADHVYRMQSFWSAEGKLVIDSVSELQLEPSWNRCATRVEKFGNLGSLPVRKYFPFLVLEDSKTGDFIGVQLYSPSSWQMDLLCRWDETLSMVGGIADREFGHWFKYIEPAESFSTPKAVIATGKSLLEVCDKLVKAQQPDISPLDGDMAIAFNEYCTTWGNPSFENMKKVCDVLKGKGVKYLVMDSGWYGQEEYWWTSIGDWDVNEKKFPGGLKETADYIRSCGMIPGIWFEFESVGTGSRHYKEKEHLLQRDGEILTVGERHFYDMENSWVIDYLSEKVIQLLKSCGFGYLKVDYNDTIGIGCDGAESLGEGLRRKVLASQAFFRKIKEEIPEIVIENCASGGHRLEPSMMELVSQASFSDAHEIPSMPIIAANLHRVIKPSQSQIWAVMRKEDSKQRTEYSMVNTFLGRMCLSGDIYEMSEDQWNLVLDGMDFYNAVSHIIKDGRTEKIECTVDSYNKPEGHQIVVRTLGNESLIIVHRFENSTMPVIPELEGATILREYGELSGDFTAKAFYIKK